MNKNHHVKVRCNQSGFTLLEVMIVCVVIAILAAIAFPSYQDSLRKSRRAEAKAAITRTLQAQERWFTANNTYVAYASAGTPPTNSGMDGYSSTNTGTRYTINAQACGGGLTIAQCVTVSAAPTAADPTCGTLSMTSQGARSPATAGCW